MYIAENVKHLHWKSTSGELALNYIEGLKLDYFFYIINDIYVKRTYLCLFGYKVSYMYPNNRNGCFAKTAQKQQCF